MVNIPIRDISGPISEVTPNDLLAMDTGTQMRKTTVKKVVDAGAPLASEAEAIAGIDNDKRMSALRTKQSIASEVGVTIASKTQGDLATSAVQSVNGKTGSSVTLAKGDVGLSNVDNTSDANKPVSTATQSALNLKANTADLGSLALKSSVNDTDWSGLDLSVSNGGTGASTAEVARTNLGAASTAQAVPPGGSTGQVLSKTSNADNAVAWSNAGAGDMLRSVYDPSNISSNAFNGMPVSSRTQLSNLDVTKFKSAYLLEQGREGQFIWRTGDYAEAIAADTEEGRTLKAANVAATIGAWDRPRERAFFATDFGVKADFTGSVVTDSFNGMQCALNMLALSGGGNLVLPSGIVSCSQKLSFSNAPLRIVGDGLDASQIVFTGASTGGIEFSDSSGDANPIHALTLEGFSIKTTRQGVGEGLKATWSPKLNNPTVPHLIVDHVLICGWDDIVANYFARGFHSVDASAFRLRDLNVLASGSSMTECCFIEHAANASRYGGQLTGFNFQGGKKGLRITGHAENITASQYEVVGQEICFDIDGTASTIPGGMNPVFRLENGHANSKIKTVAIQNWEVVGLVNNDIYCGVGTDDAAGQAVQISKTRHVNVAANKIASGVPGISKEGLYVIDGSDITVAGNSFEGFKNAAMLFDGSISGDRVSVTGNTVKGFSSGQPTAQGVYVIQGRIQANISGNVFELCTKGVEGIGNNSLIAANTFKDCGTGVQWSATNYTAKNNQFSGVITPYNITGTGIKKEIYVSATVDPPSIAAGARTSVLVSVPGAVLGDFVVAAAPYDISDLVVTANVQNTNIVGLYFFNATGSAKDLPSATWKFLISS